jgi:hypothetical protein
VGELNQPVVHKLYRTRFNGVDILNRLAMGPGSCAQLKTDHMFLRLFDSFVSMAETNAYLAYIAYTGNTSRTYDHATWRYVLSAELYNWSMKRSIELREAEAGPSLRSVGNHSDEEDVLEPQFLRGHGWVNGKGKLHKTCVVCKKTCYAKCLCGDGVCGTRKKNKDCMVVH